MSVSVEGYFAINFCMNFLSMGIIARSLGRARLRRIALCATAGAVYATLAQLPALRFLDSPAAILPLSIALSAAAMPPQSVRAAVRGALSLLAGGVFLGGVQLLIMRMFTDASALVFLLGALVGAGALAAVASIRRKKLVTWEVRVFLTACGGEARFEALVDTGNRLREPVSGLPVLICEQSVLRDVLPKGYAATPSANAPPGFRHVSYGALGSSGTLACFRPELCLVDYGNGYLKSPDLWVAVYPGKMPGGVRALAPPIVGAAEGAPSRSYLKKTV